MIGKDKPSNHSLKSKDPLTSVAFNLHLTSGYFCQSDIRGKVNFGKWFWRAILVFSSKPSKCRCKAKMSRFFSFCYQSSPLVCSLLLRSSRRPPSVFFLVRIFLRSGLGFWSSLWFAISFCLVKVSSFMWFSSKRKCFWWFKCWCSMISVWGLELWSKGWSFMLFFVKREHLYLVWRFRFWGRPLLVWFLYIKGLRLWCLKILYNVYDLFRWLYGGKKTGCVMCWFCSCLWFWMNLLWKVWTRKNLSWIAKIVDMLSHRYITANILCIV